MNIDVLELRTRVRGIIERLKEKKEVDMNNIFECRLDAALLALQAAPGAAADITFALDQIEKARDTITVHSI